MKNTLSVVTILFLYLLSVSCGGNSGQAASSTGATASAESGESIYKRTCITCHQATGAGIPGTYPPLAQSDFLADKEKTINQVIKGFMGELTVNGVKYNNVMPPQQLNDDEIAAVLTYVTHSFGNNGATFTAADVQAVRAKQ